MQLELFSASELLECLRKTCTRLFTRARVCADRLDFLSFDYFMKEYDVVMSAFRSCSGFHWS